MTLMQIIWLVLVIAFAVLEAITVGLTSIWFALGALAALLSASFGGPEWLQILFFVIVSVAALVFTRPLAKKYLNSRRKPTNADRVLTMTGVVTETVDNDLSTGTVRIDGKIWTARSVTGSPIKAGALVRPMSIDGVKLYVRPEPAEEKNTAEEKKEVTV